MKAKLLVHGDPVPDSNGMFFCRRCDAFVFRVHFDYCVCSPRPCRGKWVPVSHIERARRHAKALKVRPAKGNLFLGEP